LYSFIRENVHYVFCFSLLLVHVPHFSLYIQVQRIVRYSRVYFGSFYSQYGTLLVPLCMTDTSIDVSRVTILFEVPRFSAPCVISDTRANEKSEASPLRRHAPLAHRRRGCRSCRFRRQRTKFYERLACHETRTSASMLDPLPDATDASSLDPRAIQ